MLELKPDDIVARDDVTAAAGTLAESLAVLQEMHLHDAGLRRAVAACADLLSGPLEHLLESRRESGDLPDAGQREVAQADALGLRVRTLFSEDAEAEVIATDLLERCDELLARLGRAEAFAGENAAVDQAMAALQEAAGQVRETLRALV